MAELYNATGSVRTLLGNWQEEQELKQITGTSRCKLTNAAGCVASHTVHEPTHQRVIQHTEKESPQDWTPHSAEAFQPPGQRQDVLSYPKQASHGPREAQEMERLRAQAAAAIQPAATEGHSWSTTYAAEHQAKSMEGLKMGLKRIPSVGYVRPPNGSAAASGLTSSSIDPAVPYTMYSEAAAKATYTSLYGSLGKCGMNRNDQFTKLMGDVNKLQKLL